MKNSKILKSNKSNFHILERIFGIATFLSLVPQIYKLFIDQRAQDFSMFFIIGMLIVNLIFFLVGFIHHAIGLMIGTIIFILYNSLIIFFYLFGKDSS